MNFPALGRGLSLRSKTASAHPRLRREFPRLRAGTFIEVHLTREGRSCGTVFPRLRAGTFIEVPSSAAWASGSYISPP